MRIFLALAFLCSLLSASNILTYNIYENSNKIILRLSFDAPYDGQIVKKNENGAISLILTDLNYDKEVEKNINSQIVQNITIEPLKGATAITIKSDKEIGVSASKNADGFALRFAVEAMTPPLSVVPTTSTKKPETISSSLVDSRYFMVMGVMILLLIFLYWLKYKLQNRSINIKPKNGKKSWLFKQNPDDIRVISQKMLDQQNKIVLIEYKDKQYLILSGANNILLDRFGAQISIEDNDEFKAIFEQNRQKLDNYLKLNQPSQLDIYKQKASGDFEA